MTSRRNFITAVGSIAIATVAGCMGPESLEETSTDNGTATGTPDNGTSQNATVTSSGSTQTETLSDMKTEDPNYTPKEPKTYTRTIKPRDGVKTLYVHVDGRLKDVSFDPQYDNKKSGVFVWDGFPSKVTMKFKTGYDYKFRMSEYKSELHVYAKVSGSSWG